MVSLSEQPMAVRQTLVLFASLLLNIWHLGNCHLDRYLLHDCDILSCAHVFAHVSGQ